MANVPFSPSPTVAPSTAPTPGLNINVPAEAVGANVLGQGLQNTGKVLGQNADALQAYAQQFQAVNNKQAADTGFASYTQWQDQRVANFKANNTGVDPKTGLPSAYTNMPDLYKELEQQRTALGAGLSPMAQVEYEANTRRALSYAQSEVTNFAVEQRKTALVNTQLSLISIAQDDAAAHIDDTDRVHNDIAQIAQAHATLSSPQYNGTPDATSQELLRKDVGAIYASAIKQKLDAGDVPAAQTLYSTNRDNMTFEQSTAIAGLLKTGAKNFVVQSAAEGIVNGLPITDLRPATPGLATNSDYVNSVNSHEGTAPNPRSSAVGAGQFVNGTWLNVLKADPAFAQDIAGKTDQQILALRQDPDIAKRAIVAYGQMNAKALTADGLPTTTATIGLAHGFGSAGAASLLRADPSTPVSSLFSPEVMAANPNLKGRTAGQVVASYQSHYGNGEFTGQPGTTTAPAPPRVTAPPPPHITPNEDPNQIKSDYDTYLQTWVPKVYADDPVLAHQIMDADRSAMAVRIQAVATAQTAASARLTQAIVGGTINGNSVSDLGSLGQAYPGAADDLHLLPPAAQAEIQQHINLATAGYGAYKTPAMDANVQALEGLRMTKPSVFADSAQTNLTNIPLSAPDRLRLMSEQRQDAKSLQTQQEHTQRLQTYLSNPIVSTAVNKMWPDEASREDPAKGYTAFLGALQGKIDALQIADGKAPTQEQITGVAQQLLLQHPGDWTAVSTGAQMGGANIPPVAQQQITAAYQRALHRAPTPEEVNTAFQRGPAYYGQ